MRDASSQRICPQWRSCPDPDHTLLPVSSPPPRSDVLTGWKALVVTGLFLPFILSFVYLILLRFFAGPMVYTTVLLVNLAAVGATLYCFSKAGFIGASPLPCIAQLPRPPSSRPPA